MITVTKIFKFEAAHFLPNYDGDCAEMHGHSYKLEITVARDNKGTDPETGMVCDFKKLKNIVKNIIIRQYDHTFLNNHIENPTSENVVWNIVQALQITFLDFDIQLIRVRLYETENSYAEWTKEESI